MILCQIKTGYFVAGLTAEQNSQIIKRAAPIIKYMKGWTLARMEGYCIKKGWKFEYI